MIWYVERRSCFFMHGFSGLTDWDVCCDFGVNADLWFVKVHTCRHDFGVIDDWLGFYAWWWKCPNWVGTSLRVALCLWIDEYWNWLWVCSGKMLLKWFVVEGFCCCNPPIVVTLFVFEFFFVFRFSGLTTAVFLLSARVRICFWLLIGFSGWTCVGPCCAVLVLVIS